MVADLEESPFEILVAINNPERCYEYTTQVKDGIAILITGFWIDIVRDDRHVLLAFEAFKKPLKKVFTGKSIPVVTVWRT